MVIGRGKIFCHGHYFGLPKPLRDALWDSWREAMKARDGTFTIVQQGRINRAFQKAFEACFEYLRTAPMTSAVAMSTAAFERGSPVTYVEGRQL